MEHYYTALISIYIELLDLQPSLPRPALRLLQRGCGVQVHLYIVDIKGNARVNLGRVMRVLSIPIHNTYPNSHELCMGIILATRVLHGQLHIWSELLLFG